MRLIGFYQRQMAVCLSVKPRENRCIVTVVVQNGGERPEKIVVRVDYADTDSNQDNGQQPRAVKGTA